MRHINLSCGSHEIGMHPASDGAAESAGYGLAESPVKYYSTKDIPQHSKALYWNTLCNDLFDIDIDPLDSPAFEAQAVVGAIGPLLVTQIISQPLVVDRTQRHIARMRTLRCSLLLQNQGQSTILHQGREVRLHENDFVVFDNTYPHRLIVEKQMTLTTFAIPDKALKKHIPQPESISGLRMSGVNGLSNVVSTTLRGVWDQVKSGLPLGLGPGLAENLLDFIALSYAATNRERMTGSSLAARHRMQIKRIIEDQLCDPELSPGSIAAMLKISPRYLRMIFAGEHETVSSYILRRRLEKCTRQLTSVVWRGRTIMEIALHCGFNSAAHFSRVFRAYYGVTPREYREMYSRGEPTDLAADLES